MRGGALRWAAIAAPGLAACGGPTTAPPAGRSASASSTASAAPSVATGVPPAPQSGAREGSSVALTPEGELAIVADEDHATIDLVALPIFDDVPPARLETPGRPAQVAMVGGTLLVTIRELKEGGGALVGFTRAGKGAPFTEAFRVALPADAWGIGVSPDGSLAAVTSAWTGKLSLVDLGKHEVVWTRDVGREPRGVAFVAGGESILVSHLVETPVIRVDKARGEATVTNVDLPASPVRAPSAEKLTAHGHAR